MHKFNISYIVGVLQTHHTCHMLIVFPTECSILRLMSKRKSVTKIDEAVMQMYSLQEVGSSLVNGNRLLFNHMDMHKHKLDNVLRECFRWGGTRLEKVNQYKPVIKQHMKEREREVVSTISECGLIHFNPILFMLTLHFEQQSASSLFRPTFIPFSSTCFFHIFIGLHFYL